MSTTLYRKYRPSDFSQVIGQKHVVQTLQNSIKSGRVGQAYLFAGPRGTGKTSIARIFAKTINCTSLKNGEPCHKCEACKVIHDNRALDIIEIDAASHTGVDNIRELRETVKLPPSALKYKVYIIDEVHMLSGGAFNALLKTLEEPPAHVVFILATTEVHKIPETILSRVQRFDFTRLTVEEIMKRLSEIAKLEKVKIDREALEIIASSSEGGMRNAESLLGQVIALEDKQVTAKEVEFILGTVSEKEMADFVGLIVEKKFPIVFSKISELRDSGADFRNFGKSLLNYLRQMLIIKINPDLGKKLSYEMTKERLEQIKKQSVSTEVEEILSFINILQENTERFKNSQIPQLFLETSIATLVCKYPLSEEALADSPLRHVIKSQKVDPSITPENKRGKESHQESENTTSSKSDESDKKVKKTNTQNITADLDLVLTNWPGVIESLKSYNHSVSSVLKMSRPALIEGKYLVLKTKYDFYKEKIAETKTRLTIEEAIDKITGVNLKIKALTEKEFSEEYPGIQEKKSLLQDAMDIFGGKIVKE
jgi:DNA polymerase III subunit gamma/tau